jgi:hypothetical protein
MLANSLTFLGLALRRIHPPFVPLTTRQAQPKRIYHAACDLPVSPYRLRFDHLDPAIITIRRIAANYLQEQESCCGAHLPFSYPKSQEKKKKFNC